MRRLLSTIGLTGLLACGQAAGPDGGLDAGHGLPLKCGVASDEEPNDALGQSGVVKLKLSDTVSATRTESGCHTPGDTDLAQLEPSSTPRLITLSLDRTAWASGLGRLSLDTALDGGATLFSAADAGEAGPQVWQYLAPGTALPLQVRGDADALGGYQLAVGTQVLAPLTPTGSGADDAPLWAHDTALTFHPLARLGQSGDLVTGACSAQVPESWVRYELGSGTHALARLSQPMGLRYELIAFDGTRELARLTERSPVERPFSTDGGVVFVIFRPGTQATCGQQHVPAELESSVQAWIR